MVLMVIITVAPQTVFVTNEPKVETLKNQSNLTVKYFHEGNPNQ
jgi:hypothetical protein